jgi:hypothetical protein
VETFNVQTFNVERLFLESRVIGAVPAGVAAASELAEPERSETRPVVIFRAHVIDPDQCQFGRFRSHGFGRLDFRPGSLIRLHGRESYHLPRHRSPRSRRR